MLRFLGIGAQKAGTSWLHAMLARHPQIGFLPARSFTFGTAPTPRATSSAISPVSLTRNVPKGRSPPPTPCSGSA